MRRLLVLFALLFALPAAAPAPGLVKVEIDTSLGPITVALEARRAPITTANFLRYVDQHRFDNTSFYRAARSSGNPKMGLVQGGVDHDLRRSLLPIAHEPTTKTGLHHVDGTISMARNDPGSAMGDFFITVGPAPQLDARAGYPGYAAFGHVVSGMGVVRRILAMPTWPGGYSLDTMGQSIRKPVKIITVKRVR